MKKQKRPQQTKPAALTAPPRHPKWWPGWWQSLAALGGLLVAFVAYGPALNGAFVLDDRYLPFMDPNAAGKTFFDWIRGLRPLLYLSFWADYRINETTPYGYHVTNVLLHFLTSLLMVLVAAKLLEWVGVKGLERTLLAAFAGALFLLHPVQTESVAYVASRSEILSVFFYFAAFAVFIYRNSEAMTVWRALAIVALFGAAVATKEHTLTLPVLLVLTDYFWSRGGLRKNGILYGLLTLAAAGGAVVVWRVLRGANTAGFGMSDLPPLTYFFTQCRVIWTYVRMFVLPYGQNADPDVALSPGVLDHGAIFGLIALVAAVAAAWIYRKRWPLASFGVLIFILLLAPTSSVVPIRDVLAERRLYLPFLGLVLVCLEFLRRLRLRQAAWVCAAAVVLCAVFTYQRSQVWASPLALWEDTVAKSPQKIRPRFQLAYALYEENRCPEAVQSYETASRLGPSDDQLLIDWGLALDCAGRANDAIEKLRLAALIRNTAHIHALIGMVYGKRSRNPEALDELAEAEKLNPGFDMTYVYRGNVYESSGNRPQAAREYQRALAANPLNQAARDALARVSR
jgi:Tfp pilus assembly protein PilF